MCGVFLVHTSEPINQIQCEKIAKKYISTRGPDSTSIIFNSHQFVCQSVLAIQTNSENCYRKTYSDSIDKVFLYNGELYNLAQDFNWHYSDTQWLTSNIHNTDFESLLSNVDGMYVIVSGERTSVGFEYKIYRDPIGEKHVYYYQDSSLFIVSSVPGAINEYLKSVGLYSINLSEFASYFSTRHYISPENTFTADLYQIKPGHCLNYTFSHPAPRTYSFQSSVASLFDPSFYNHLSRISYDQYFQEYSSVLDLTARRLSLSNLQSKDAAFVVSGGIDSSLSASILNPLFDGNCAAFTCTFGDKDIPSKHAHKLARHLSLPHVDVEISCESYFEALKQSIYILGAPVHTHSQPSSFLLAQSISSRGYKIVFSGEGADELCLGYSTYLNIESKSPSLSDYSRFIDNPLSSSASHSLSHIHTQIPEFPQFSSTSNPDHKYIKGAALIDYMYQLPMVGLSSIDSVMSHFGLEARTLFTRQPLLSFFINSPVEKLIRNQSVLKHPLHRSYIKNFGVQPLSKSGFSGFPNESASYLPHSDKWLIFDLYPQLKAAYVLNRSLDWKIINSEWFLQLNS